MQRIYPCALTVEEYVASEWHRQVRPELKCPRCGKPGRWHRHGTYRRGVTGSLGRVLMTPVARFLCLWCERTVSYLPDFALSYRLIAATSFEAFLERKLGRRDLASWEPVLRQYERRMKEYAVTVFRVVGCGFGRGPPGAGADIWPWLKAACGGLRSATRQLVTVFGITPFKRYQCHQPARR